MGESDIADISTYPGALGSESRISRRRSVVAVVAAREEHDVILSALNQLKPDGVFPMPPHINRFKSVSGHALCACKGQLHVHRVAGRSFCYVHPEVEVGQTN